MSHRNRTCSVIRRHERSSSASSMAEIAGDTTAGFAAIICCAPYGVANMLILAVYKVPAGLCRKAMRKWRRRRMLQLGMMQPPPIRTEQAVIQWSKDEVEVITEEEFEELEKEMWAHFAAGGFWRCNSASGSSRGL